MHRPQLRVPHTLSVPLLLLVLLALAGCGGSPTPESTQAQGSAPGDQETPTPPPEATATPTQAPTPPAAQLPSDPRDRDWRQHAFVEDGIFFLGNPQAPIRMLDYSDFL